MKTIWCRLRVAMYSSAVAAISLLFSCSGGSSHAAGKTQMGGAIQGGPLSLTNSVTTLAGTAGVAGSADGTGAAAAFRNPVDITSDGSNLYVADAGNNTIRKIIISSRAVTTLAGTAGVAGSADGTGAAAAFRNPSGITTDGANLYVADSGNNTIRKIAISTGVVTTLAGTVGIAGSADGIGAAATFRNPKGITTDGTNVYVADAGNNTIRQIAISTGVVSTLAGTAGHTGSADGTGAAAAFNGVTALTTDGAALYATDSGNGFRKITLPAGIVTTFPGTIGSSGGPSSLITKDVLIGITGITTDGSSIYVAVDAPNSIIVKQAMPAGTVTTLAGTAGVPGAVDGTGSAASFSNPQGITTDGTCLYVTDSNTIRRIQ